MGAASWAAGIGVRGGTRWRFSHSAHTVNRRKCDISGLGNATGGTEEPRTRMKLSFVGTRIQIFMASLACPR